MSPWMKKRLLGRPRFLSLATAGALLLASAVGQAQGPPDDRLEEVRRAIKARGARWHADVTSVSHLSLEEKKMRLGLKKDHRLATAPSFSEIAPEPLVTAAPSTLDWRNVQGVSYVSPVKNQGSCGSCWAFATAAALESQVMIANGGLTVDLSEQTLVSCSGAGSCSGGYLEEASTFNSNVGLPSETCFPYTRTNDSCANACADWKNNTDQITGWRYVSSKTSITDGLKNALYAYGPVIVDIEVYQDFYYYKGGVYSYSSGSYLGYHAILLVGYDDVTQAFIAKNSWGTGWGEAGYFRISYSETTGKSRFGNWAIAYDGYRGDPVALDTTPPIVGITSPTSGATVSATTTVTVGATDNVGVTAVELYLNGGLFGTRSTAPFSFTWDTSKASNDRYSLHAVAHDAAGNSAASALVDVTVNNVPDTTPPTVTITSPSDGGSVTKVVKVSVSAVDDGGLDRIEVRAGDSVLGSMNCSGASRCSGSFNWNTNKGVPKGEHTLTAYAYDSRANRGESTTRVYKK